MGIMNGLIGSRKGSNYGASSLSTKDVLDVGIGALNPKSKVGWKIDLPTVLESPVPASVHEADRAESEANRYEHGVTQGLRILKAEERRQVANARLVKGHRRYMAVTAQSHYAVAAANRGLAGAMHDLRDKYAELGYGLDRADERSARKIEDVAHKYGVI